jgi:hypothetical protein
MNLIKVAKLIHRLRALVSFLEREQTLSIHQNVSQFFYMQRIEELQTLCELFEAQENTELISVNISIKYVETYYQWRKDILWIHRCEYCREINI